MKYHSKIDWWMYLAPVSMLLLTIFWIFWLCFTEDSSAMMSWGDVVPMILTCALMIWLYAGTYYRLDEDMLRIRCGPFRRNVAYESITDVCETRSLISSMVFSSMALSLDRIVITYNKGHRVRISPKDKQDFLEQLSLRRPR